MADSMCGPSNALQSFQKHSAVDRTLQQDRLVARQSPAQGFRSAPGPNAGLLDPEFEAFQAGQLPLDHAFQPQQFSHAGPSASLHQPGPANWASDFQRMNISSPAPQISQNSFNHQVQQRQDGGWHQEFVRQQSQGVDQTVGQIPYQRYTPMSGMMATQFGGGFAGPQIEASIAQQKQPEAFDEEAFTRAFDEAARAETAQLDIQETIQGSAEIGQDIMIEESAERLMASDALSSQQRIGADSIYDPQSEELGRAHEDPNALAKTAGHLLDSIRHEQSSKFQNSQFLELMRQFRDGQATVEGDKVVGINDETGGSDEASKQRGRELASLTQSLKKLVLDRDRPFQRSPENVRVLLHLLLQMEGMMKGVNEEGRGKIRVERVLSAVVSNPALKDLGSILAQAEHARNLSLAPHSLISKANEQILSFDTESTVNIAQRYVAAELSGDHQLSSESMEKLLGYSIPKDVDEEVLAVHEKRMSDILGMAICRVLATVENRGFLCKELSLRTFFDLVGDYERFLDSRRKGDYDAFVVAVLGAERDVENTIQRFLVGVQAEERVALSFEQQIAKGEYERRLGLMRAGREANPFPGERLSAEEEEDMMSREMGIGSRDPSGHLDETRDDGWRADEMRDRAEEAVGRVKTG